MWCSGISVRFVELQGQRNTAEWRTGEHLRHLYATVSNRTQYRRKPGFSVFSGRIAKLSFIFVNQMVIDPVYREKSNILGLYTTVNKYMWNRVGAYPFK